MVFSTVITFARRVHIIPGPDKWWNRRRTFKHSAHFYGRRRNCYRIAIRGVIRAFRHATQGRRDKKRDLSDLRDLRISAGSEEHGINYGTFMEGIQRSLILLNRKILADLAIWEPRSFKALTDVAKCKALEDSDISYPGMERKDISHFIHRGLLEKKAE